MAQASYQVSIQAVKAVAGVGVVAWPVVLRADELHDLVLAFAWSLQIKTHAWVSALPTHTSVDISCEHTS